MPHRRRWAALCAAVVTAASVTAIVSGAGPAAAVTATGAYHSLTPARVLDTRNGTGAAKAAVGSHQSIALSLGSRGGLPAKGAFSAAVLNVTATGVTAAGFVTVYPDGAALPGTSNLDVVPGPPIANLVMTRVPADGIVRLYNGSTKPLQLVADVSGYYTGSDAPTGQGGFGTIPAPVRILDTRNGTGTARAAVAPHGTVTFTATGRGVPGDANAVVLNVIAVTPGAYGNLRVFPAGDSVPTASNVNFVAGQTIPNLVLARIGSSGRVSVYNDSAKSVQIVADLFGYFTAGDPLTAGALGALSPVRLLDTRNGTGVAKGVVSGQSTASFTVTGRGGVPKTGVAAVVLNVTAVPGNAGGYLTVYAAGLAQRPVVSNLDFGPNAAVPNLVVTGVGTNGMVTVFNGSTAPVNVVADVAGYVLSSDVSNAGHGVPSVSVSRYIRALSGTSSSDLAADQSVLDGNGCSDATAGSTLVLLDIGAQSVNSSPTQAGFDALSAGSPGVLLTGTTGKRLTYPHLVADLQAYIDGFNRCASGTAIVAVGTNNDGDFGAYGATQKGTDWANDVVLALSNRAHVAVVGANDIEAGFASTAVEASQWEQAYLTATSATNGLLIDNGSLDGCPTSYNSVAECGPFTRQDYVTLLHDNGPTRILALPQVYFDSQAVQWSNIDAAAGGAIAFIGSLTQHGVACGANCTMTPLEGFAALYHAVSTVVTSPNIPNITDLVSS